MSGLVKGVKKAFKAIGDVVKKVFSNKIFKFVLIAAAAIFTGGAALGAFGAMGAVGGATFGSVMSGALAGGLAPFQAALGALGMGSAAATTATTATTAGAEAGGIAAGGDAMAAAAAEAAAPGTAAWAAPAADTSALFGGAEAAGSTVPALGGESGLADAAGAQTANNGFQLMPNATSGTGATQPGWAAQTMTAANNPANVTGGMINTAGNTFGPAANAGGDSWVSNIFKDMWSTIKPETGAGYRMWGNLMLGAGQGVMSGRNQQAQRDWQDRMSAVPDVTNSFEQKPGYRWALMGPAHG